MNGNRDEAIGIRWDWGERREVGGKTLRNLVLQANKGAAQVKLKKLANKNSHRKLLTIELDLDRPQELEEFKKKWLEGVRRLGE
ncbi:hypothetical protein EW146_g6686 [Bondarzewia mesenterica]|uniref:Uncharacterized protein n=1 Tax=Bondarzewia mesenterica TaxID=1095465 RepID=A0A4S4LN21_9AGAM|nr:hypothetical protein EW146_g6686 [Bondarzewia mesenterica]